MRSSRNMRWQLFLMGILALCVFGCNSAKRATTSPETDALLRAARLGNADTVKSLLVSPNVDVNGVDAEGNTALIEAARFGHDDVITQGLIRRSGIKAIRPKALVERAELKIGLVVEQDARETLFVFAERNLAHAEIAIHLVEGAAAELQFDDQVVEVWFFG